MTTVEEVSGALGVPGRRPDQGDAGDRGNERMVLALVRGDHRLNELKLRNALGADFRPAHAEEIAAELGPAGFIGPVGAELPMLKDAAIEGEGYVCGANEPDAHLIGVAPGRDFTFEEVDMRSVEAGDMAPGGQPIEIERAIEVAGIFKLGTRYSEPLGATYLDEEAKSARSSWAATGSARRARSPRRSSRAPTRRGSCGRGRSPPGTCTWSASASPATRSGRPQTRSTRSSREAGAEVLYDDRDAGPGEKLTDAELLGCPLRLVVGKRGLADGVVEAQVRAQGRPSASRSPRRRAAPLELLDGID